MIDSFIIIYLFVIFIILSIDNIKLPKMFAFDINILVFMLILIAKTPKIGIRIIKDKSMMFSSD